MTATEPQTAPDWYPILDTAPWTPFCVMNGCDHSCCPAYARKQFRAAVKLSYREFVTAVHLKRCDTWFSGQVHGVYYQRRAIEYCGQDARDHIDRYMRLPWLAALHFKHH